MAALVSLAGNPEDEHQLLSLTTLRTLACARHIQSKAVFASHGAVGLMVRMLGSGKEACLQEAALGLAGLASDPTVRYTLMAGIHTSAVCATTNIAQPF